MVRSELERQARSGVIVRDDDPIGASIGDRLSEQPGVELRQGHRVGAVEHDVVQSSEHAESMTEAVTRSKASNRGDAEIPLSGVWNALVADEDGGLRVSLVAGASRGAGRAIAVELARAGVYEYATGRSSRVSGSVRDRQARGDRGNW